MEVNGIESNAEKGVVAGRGANQDSRNTRQTAVRLPNKNVKVKTMAENVKEDPETPLKKLFGDTPLVRVVDVLIENPRIGYSKRELAEAAEIGLDDLNKIWRKLEEKNLIHKSPGAGVTALYTANLESSLLKALATLERKKMTGKKLEELPTKWPPKGDIKSLKEEGSTLLEEVRERLGI